MRVRRYLYALVPATVGALVCGVVVVAVAVTLLPAFFASSDGSAVVPDVGAWRTLAAVPGIGSGIALTFATGIGATLVSFVVACSVGAWAMTPVRRSWALVVSAAVAAVPSDALAAGLSALASPAPAASAGAWWPRWLPDVHAGTGLLLTTLCLRIAPFLAAMVLIAMRRTAAERDAAVAGTLGYGRAEVFVKLVLPRVYPRLRLPVCAALAWSFSAVGAARLVDPAGPSQLAVFAWHGFVEGGQAQRALGAATAAAVLVVALAAVVCCLLLERAAIHAGRTRLRSGRHGVVTGVVTGAVAGVGVVTAAAGLAIVVVALAALVPNWAVRGPAHAAPEAAFATLAIGVVATLAALAVTIACLEAEDRSRRRSAWPVLLWVPWIVPQIAFVPGLTWILSDLGVRAPFAAVIVSQMVFVLPCVALALAASWRALDPRYARCAAALRAAPRRILARVKLPLIAQPIAIACAIGFAASAGQFLSTRLVVPGRIATLDTAVVSSSTAPRSREAALEATLLALVPALLVALAIERRTRRAGAALARQPVAG